MIDLSKSNEIISRVYNMDCMEFLRQCPDKFFELAIVDPPYGSSIMAKNKHQRHKTTATSYRNKTIPGKEYFSELERVSKATTIFGAQYMMEFLKPGGSFIVWDKGADPDKHNMSSCDIAYYSKRVKVKKIYLHWCGAVKCEKEPTIHIHQKPVSLYAWLLKNYAKKGDRILDTHLGSQSSRIAAHKLGFDFWGTELDPKFYADGNERFLRETELPLFEHV